MMGIVISLGFRRYSLEIGGDCCASLVGTSGGVVLGTPNLGRDSRLRSLYCIALIIPASSQSLCWTISVGPPEFHVHAKPPERLQYSLPMTICKSFHHITMYSPSYAYLVCISPLAHVSLSTGIYLLHASSACVVASLCLKNASTLSALPPVLLVASCILLNSADVLLCT